MSLLHGLPDKVTSLVTLVAPSTLMREVQGSIRGLNSQPCLIHLHHHSEGPHTQGWLRHIVMPKRLGCEVRAQGLVVANRWVSKMDGRDLVSTQTMPKWQVHPLLRGGGERGRTQAGRPTLRLRVPTRQVLYIQLRSRLEDHSVI